MKNNTSVQAYRFEIYRLEKDTDFSGLYNYTGAETHMHPDFYEFSLIISGAYDNIHKGVHHKLEKNTLIFFKIGEQHALHSLAPNSLHFSFIIKEKLMDQLFSRFFPDQNISQFPSYVERHLAPIEGEHLAHLASLLMENTSWDMREHRMQLFVFNALSSCILDPRSPKHLDSTDQYVAELLSRLNNYLYLSYTVSDIYKEFPLAQSTLITAFKKKTGYNIIQYHTMKKLDYAAHLLASPSTLSIAEVSKTLNFSSTSHFSKRFKEHFHITPSEYRRLHVRYHILEEGEVGANY